MIGNPERMLIIVLIIISLYLIIKEPRYVRLVKLIKIIPRIYLLVYYTLIVTDLYSYTGFADVIRRGVGSTYGVLLLLVAEVYLQWANKIYGKK